MALYSVKALHAVEADLVEADSASVAVALYLAELPFGHNLGSVSCRRFIYGELDCDLFTIAGHLPH